MTEINMEYSQYVDQIFSIRRSKKTQDKLENALRWMKVKTWHIKTKLDT